MICCFQPSCLQSSLPTQKDSGSFLKEKLLDPSVPGASCLNFGRCRPPWEGLLKQKPCAGEMTLMVLAFTFGPFSSQLSHESMEKFSTVGTWDQICLLAKWCWCCPRSPGRSQTPTQSCRTYKRPRSCWTGSSRHCSQMYVAALVRFSPNQLYRHFHPEVHDTNMYVVHMLGSYKVSIFIANKAPTYRCPHVLRVQMFIMYNEV